MKPLLTCLALLLLFLARGQDSIPRKMIFKTKVFTVNGLVRTGYLAYLADSSLLLSPYPVPLQSSAYTRSRFRGVAYTDLQKVRVQRKGSIGRGILYGSLSGLAFGVVSGLVQGPDPDQTITLPDFMGGTFTTTIGGMTAGEKAFILGFTGMLGGAIIGGLVGWISHKVFHPRGKYPLFTEMKEVMLKKITL